MLDFVMEQQCVFCQIESQFLNMSVLPKLSAQVFKLMSLT